MAAMTKAELATENDALRKSLSREVAKRKVLERRCATLSEARSEAREQQVATGEILRVISQSPTDTRPVFDTIVRNARRLCEADSCSVFTYGDELIHLESIDNATVEGADAIRRAYPLPPNRGHASGRAILTGRPVHIPDVRNDPEYDLHGILGAGLRSILAVPMLRDGLAIGTITLHTWATPRPFTDAQIELLKTFADQAVIAIENVRLFTELQQRNRDVTEALEQQTATSEILRVISSSPTDVQPTFEAIAASSRRLCEAAHGMVFRFDGDLIHLAAHDNLGTEQLDAVRSVFPIRPGRGSVTARAILTRSLVHVRDRREDPEFEYSALSANFPNTLSVPLLRDGVPLGAITVTRAEIGLFSTRQIALLQTFADQAVIAIENVRLFTELGARNRDLTEALEQQTATSEILRVISSSPTDVQPVFDTIVRSAVRLCDGLFSALFQFDGELIHQVAHHNFTPEALEAQLRVYPTRPSRGLGAARAILDRAVVHIPDFETDREHQHKEVSRAIGCRSGLFVPMLREGAPIGAIMVARAAAGPFSDSEIELLKTFADQAVIAVENVRLFKELEAANRQLEAASRHKSEFLANMSHELRTPLNAVIGFSEVLLQRMFGDLNDKQDEYLKDIYASGQHLLSLINDILDLSKIEAGRMELTPAPFHLPSALENAVTLVRERAARHGIALHLDLDPRLGELVGDERKVKQVLLNLLSNAVKFTPEGGRISLKAGPRDGAVEISVTDTGIGIAPEDQAAIFEEFRQVGSDETRKQEGTGLGLTLAKKFVELHGGRIWVQSKVGRGSTFTVTLPVRPWPAR